MATFIWLVVGIVIFVGLLVLALALYAAWMARKVEAIVPPLGRFVEIAGARLHYLDEGAGPPLVLVHGLGGQMRNFTHSLLAPLKERFRVIIVERPGNGYSTPAAGANVGAHAEILAQFLDALEIERPLVIGHSLGGAISLALAARHPDKIGGLALIAPVTTLPDAVPSPFQGLDVKSPGIRNLIAWTLAIPGSIANRQRALDTLFGPQAVPADFPVKGGGLLSLRPQTFIGASRDLVASAEDLPDLPALYANLKIPVGIIYGTGDRVLDHKRHCEALADKIAGLDCELIDGGGHMILIASADRCAAFIMRMAAKLPADTKSASAA